MVKDDESPRRDPDDRGGWLVSGSTRGSHRQYKHPTKPGRVHQEMNDFAGLMRYAVVIEKADGNFSGYVPDLPGSRRDRRNGQGSRGRTARCNPVSYRGPEGRWYVGSCAASIADYVRSVTVRSRAGGVDHDAVALCQGDGAQAEDQLRAGAGGKKRRAGYVVARLSGAKCDRAVIVPDAALLHPTTLADRRPHSSL